MQPLEDSPLAGAARFLDRPAVIDGDRAWSWRQVHEAAIALSHRLGDASAVSNLCASRLGFLVTFIAALRNRCLIVLPPSTSSADLAAVHRPHARPVAAGDPGTCPELAGERGRAAPPFLSCRPEWRAPSAADRALAWTPAWDGVAVLLHTSGSTGDPQAQPKTLRHLATGALLLGERLAKEVEGGLAAIDRIVCSVPPQHMFGLECSVMLPLLHGTPILDRRPLLPADVRAAFAGGPRGVWIATPMHLRSLVQTAESIPSCSAAVVSTMPLGQLVARQSEPLLGAPVLEIYGSTETGALAMRRTARESRWLPMSGVRLERVEGASLAHGAHFASPMKLLDELVLEANGSFLLLGRQADLIKIAGRRASLAGLNLLLQELPGLDDGVFYLPDTGNPAERLCLMYAGLPLDRAKVRRWLRARLDPVFLPRDLIRLDRLPRNDSGKLPRQSLELAYAAWQMQAPTQSQERPGAAGASAAAAPARIAAS
ncbi:MAG: class I adenylate-forming enzyme family protein [Caldimonas sp.]